MSTIKILRTNSENPDFIRLVTLLDGYLAEKDGDQHPFYAQYNTLQTINHVVVVKVNGIGVACGAFKKYDSTKAEIKRMFVDPAFRGQGLAKKILKELEEWAKEFHFTMCILETGQAQHEAISLYLGTGYSVTPNYGQYENVENSICMKKVL